MNTTSGGEVKTAETLESRIAAAVAAAKPGEVLMIGRVESLEFRPDGTAIHTSGDAFAAYAPDLRDILYEFARQVKEYRQAERDYAAEKRAGHRQAAGTVLGTRRAELDHRVLEILADYHPDTRK